MTIVFGSPEAAALLRRDRLARDLEVDNGAKVDVMPQDHLFIGSQVVALCGAHRAHVEEYCRPFDPAEGQYSFDEAGICGECWQLAMDVSA